MKHVLKASFLVVLGAMLLGVLHSHSSEHPVPHPETVKVSLAKRVVPQLRLPVARVIVAVPATENLRAIAFVATPRSSEPIKTERSSRPLRGPPLICAPYAR